jgi:hypothetical protein
MLSFLRIPSLPFLPIVSDFHSLLAFSVQAFGPFLSSRRTKAQRIVEFLCDVFDMLFVVVFTNLDVCRKRCRVQDMRRNIVVVLGDEREGECGSKRRRSGE